MEFFINFIIEYLFIILLLISIILFIWNITITIRLTGLKKRFLRFARGSNTNNLEQLIEMYSQDFDKLKNAVETNTKKIDFIQNKIKTYKGKASIVRYNAFGEEGNDLSYSIAILDEMKNGIVITSIFNRGESNTYAKPVEEGTSKYKLSSEELLAIQNALQE